jgi:glucose-1-phosphatase
MIQIPNGTKALLLDLGGVLIDLHLQRTFDAFHQLGFLRFEQHFDSYSGSPFIEIFEEGKMSNDDFIATLKKHCKPDTTTDQILTAWNAMLGDVPQEKFRQLQQWSKEYKVFLYSNTNALHVAHLNLYYNLTFGENVFQNCFTKMYYSQELGIRKPHKEGYLKIMEEQQLQPQDIFYIEDGTMHLATAQSLGLQCLLWKQNAPFHFIA